MKRKITAILLVVALAVSLSLVPAASVAASNGSPAWVLVEELDVDSNGAVAPSTNTLVDGWMYYFEASGTYDANAGITADAEYSSGPDSYVWQDFVEKYEGWGEGLLELKVDGSFVEWGDYTPSHVYTLDYVGTGNPVSFQIYDIAYNNTGLLHVKIYATPVMVTTSLSGPASVEVNEEASWDITITVDAKYADVEDVVVQDGMGADLDQIVLGTPTEGIASTAKKGKGKMGATMVTWDVGDLDAGDSETLVVTVTTGWNSPGNGKKVQKHEFTTAELGHELDGGASATYWYGEPLMEYQSPETDPLTVDVVEPTL